MKRAALPSLLALLLLSTAPVLAGGADAPAAAEAELPPIPEPGTPVEAGATVIEADRLEATQDDNLRASGKAEFRRDNRSLKGDELIYFPLPDEAYGEGQVELRQENGDLITGSRLHLKMDSNVGTMEGVTLEMGQRAGRGSAESVKFDGPDHAILEQATYTTCPTGVDDWFLRVGSLDIDRKRQVGTARNASIVFKDVPVLYTPWMDFPLSDARKTGFLSPTVGSSDNSGAEVIVPFYWNIAPNRDYTIAPRFMGRRGMQLNNEFRYLEPGYHGELRVEFLPDDRVTKESRYGWNIQHTHDFRNGWSGYLQAQRVSDDTYFTDLSDRISATSQTNLPRDGYLAYSGGWWTATGRLQSFQTLQDPNAPVVSPYSRRPQLTLGASRENVAGFDLGFSGEFVEFDHPTLVNGRRTVAYPTVSYPLVTSFAYLTPKLGLHMTRYNLDRDTTTLPDSTRNVPIFSLDSGMTFEREAEIRGNTYLQTLEPRLYYVRVPFRDQTRLPNFDSAITDINFAQLFTENQFSGSDRINDANQLTLALTSRLLDPASGRELIRAAVGQRYYRDRQSVTLDPGTPARTSDTSDLLAAISGQLAEHWTADAGWQFNTDESEVQKTSVSVRYQPAPLKTLNMSYRYTGAVLENLDMSGQWPLSGRWYGVARMNYSLRDSRLVEGIGGLEYDGGCWVVRAVAQRFATQEQDVSNSFFLQLELNGLTKLGANPLELLKQNISGYRKINEPWQATGTDGR